MVSSHFISNMSFLVFVTAFTQSPSQGNIHTMWKKCYYDVFSKHGVGLTLHARGNAALHWLYWVFVRDGSVLGCDMRVTGGWWGLGRSALEWPELVFVVVFMVIMLEIIVIVFRERRLVIGFWVVVYGIWWFWMGMSMLHIWGMWMGRKRGLILEGRWWVRIVQLSPSQKPKVLRSA